MSQQRFTLPSAVFLILERDNRVLLMRRANTGWHDGDYDFPAGHIDGGESSKAATAREGAEELGIVVVEEDLSFVLLTHGLSSDSKEYYNLYFRVSSWQGEPRIMEPDKCNALEWFGLEEDLPLNITPNTLRGLVALKDNSSYLEYGF